MVNLKAIPASRHAERTRFGEVTVRIKDNGNLYTGRRSTDVIGGKREGLSAGD